jgi:hypothetical protein
MKHNWRTPEYKTQEERIKAFMGDLERVCSNCGVRQHRETSHSWMRVCWFCSPRQKVKFLAGENNGRRVWICVHCGHQYSRR